MDGFYSSTIFAGTHLAASLKVAEADLIQDGLECYSMEAQVVAPWVDPEEAQREYVLMADPWRLLMTPSGVMMDLKGIVPRELDALRL